MCFVSPTGEYYMPRPSSIKSKHCHYNAMILTLAGDLLGRGSLAGGGVLGGHLLGILRLAGALLDLTAVMGRGGGAEDEA